MDEYPGYARFATIIHQSDAFNALIAALVAVGIGWLWLTRKDERVMRLNRVGLAFGGVLFFIVCALL